MSTPRQPFKNTEEIQIGFLSIRAAEVLEQVLSHSALSETEMQTLGEAEEFLQSIADGASIATTGLVRQGVSPSRSIAAFDMALGPIEALKSLVNQDDGLDTFFKELADAVHSARSDKNVPVEKVKNARSFFDSLQQWISAELSSRNVALPFDNARFA